MPRYFRTGIIPKPVQWLGDSRKALRAFPSDWKPMASIGAGASEIRESVYVLHAFTKKTQETSLHDVRLAQRRYRDMIAQRGTK